MRDGKLWVLMIFRAAFGLGLIWLVMPHPPVLGMTGASARSRNLSEVKAEIDRSLTEHGGNLFSVVTLISKHHPAGHRA
jgi:hypothetical protein